jgi:hypothetical protein
MVYNLKGESRGATTGYHLALQKDWASCPGPSMAFSIDGAKACAKRRAAALKESAAAICDLRCSLCSKVPSRKQGGSLFSSHNNYEYSTQKRPRKKQLVQNQKRSQVSAAVMLTLPQSRLQIDKNSDEGPWFAAESKDTR